MGAGERLHLQAWLPAGPDIEQLVEPVAVIALVHGYGDHGGRHTWFGEDMAARGYAVYAYDLRGHGQSTGTRVGSSASTTTSTTRRSFWMRCAAGSRESRWCCSGTASAA